MAPLNFFSYFSMKYTLWHLSQDIKESANFCFLPRLLSTKNGFLQRCLCNSASCRDSQQEAKSHRQCLQEVIYHAQQSRQETRDHGQSRRKPNMTDRTVSAEAKCDRQSL